VAEAFGEFCRGVVDVVAPLVPAVKPQWAFFEQLGAVGIAELERIVHHARNRGLLVIADAKRGDIGSTAEAYAEAFFRLVEGRPFCDAVTLNPYLGSDSWQPFWKLAVERHAGLFVLVKTSNPGSGEIQDLIAGQSRVYQVVAEQIESLNRNARGSSGYGPAGAVIGATYPAQLADLRQQMPSTWILVPGFGAQGGTAKDVAGGFDDHGLGAVVNSSRAILFAHRDRNHPRANGNWQAAVEQATRDAIDQLRADTPAGRL
jgi:orotidine-5'-phosphate decarboxylase